MARVARLTHLAALLAASLALTLLRTGATSAQQIQPLPPDGVAYGMKLSEWAVAYVQWFTSIPAASSPVLRLDTTGERMGVGQRAPVWFIPPYSVGASGTRTVVLPEGHAVLVAPAFHLLFDTPGNSTEAELLAIPATYLDRIKVLAVSMDGTPIPDIKPFRVKTPLFSIPLAPDNLFALPVGAGNDARQAAAAEGYWFLYPPLPVGKHVISIHQEGISALDQAYTSDWTFNLIVQKPNAKVQ